MRNAWLYAFTISLATIVWGYTPSIVAQQEEAAEVDELMLEEVIVTSRRRQENIQDIPVAVTAITAEEINRSFPLDTTSLQTFAPNVVFDTIEMGTPAGGGFSIRGIGYQDVDKGFDPTVLVSLDDVPLATGTGQVFDLIDIERIEVLRGPQGTLFGKNVVGGLINIHRTKPQLDETSTKIRLRAGEYEKYSGDVMFNYGAENWALKLTGGIARQGEGFIDNVAGGDLWNRDIDRFGAHVLWEPNEDFTAEAIYDYSKLDGTAGAVFLTDIDEKDVFCLLTGIFDSLGVPPGGVFCSRDPGEPATGDWDTSAANYRTDNLLEKHQLTFRLTADVTDDHTVTYIGSWMQADDDQYLDGDATPYSIYHFRRWGDYEQLTNELRLNRDTGSNLTWQVGMFYAWAEGTNNQDTILTMLDPNCFFDGSGQPCSYEYGVTTSSSYSFFGEGDYAMMDERLVFTVGARYISETKKLARSTFNYATGEYDLPPNSGGSRTDDETIYRLGVRFNFTDELMAYGTVSTGFRSGGLPPRAHTPSALARGYDPEELTNYEAGLRSTFFDRRLLFNATVFRMDYEDMQIELAIPALNPDGSRAGTGTQLAVENVGEARLEGIELEAEWLVFDWWRLSGNLGTLDANYEDLYANLWGDVDEEGNLLPPEDESDLDLRRAPELTYTLVSFMDWDLAGGNLGWRISYSYTDDYEATITNYPGSRIGKTKILDSSVSYEFGNWLVSLFGRNLTDEETWTHSYVVNPIRPTDTDPAPGTLWRFAQRRAPREIGLELQYRF